MTSWATSYYVNFLNQTRFSKNLIPDPNGRRELHPKTPTKWAVLSVLATRVPLSVSDIRKLLEGLSYRRGRSSILKALKRCEGFGLANPFGRVRKRKWVLTDRGKELLNAPRKPMKSVIKDLVQKELQAADKWMSVADLYDSTSYNANTISRILRSNKNLFKSEIIPGDPKRRKQWAYFDKDTTNWTNATSRRTPKVLFRRTSKLSKPAAPAKAVAAIIPNNPTYQGFPMCLSAATAAKPSLIQAVGDLVTSEFLPAQKKFSAHDVTKRMRELVSQPTTTVNPAETGTVHVAGKSVPKIAHDDVREIVHELFSQGLLTGYDRIHNGTHFEYDTLAAIAAADSWAKAAAAAATAAATPTTTSSTPAGQDGSSYDGSSTI